MSGWVLILDPDRAVQAIVQLVTETRRADLAELEAVRRATETDEERDRREWMDRR